MSRTVHFTDEQIIEALEKTAGVQAAAAEWLRESYGRTCSRQLINNRLAKSPEMRAALQEIFERNLDVAESKLFKAIGNGESWAIMLLLKTKGKHRGYSEKLEVAGGLTVTHKDAEAPDFDNMDLDQLREWMADQSARPLPH